MRPASGRSTVITTAATPGPRNAIHATSPLPASQRALLAIVALAALVSLIDSPYPGLAPLQNIPTLFIASGIALALRRWPLPTSAVGCLTAFLLLHTLGGRYA